MLDPEAVKVLNLAPVELAAYAQANPDKLRSVYEALEGIATGAVRASAYLAMRDGYGMGDQGHTKAVKESNKVVAKVRKALGFNITHPVNF